ncbi:MAG TPA: hypothetical protein ENG01_01285 [Candidatus Aenigmarchaeota archaeon]|nr:MAG: hypothetical protein DRN75_03775 [Nanoarchaeota archaeon]HDO79978.1 hypothetical protein [Candidatus Aenigmarchaeota archaeon]HEX33030.1 hypothetical protein [Candidatus Aenigmarchaeota archaeon]
MSRKRKGRDSYKICEYCHERVPSYKAFSTYRRGIKIYLCPDCAKRRGIRVKHAYQQGKPRFRRRSR